MSFGYWNDDGKFVITSNKFSKFKTTLKNHADLGGTYGFYNDTTDKDFDYHLWFVPYSDLQIRNYSDDIIKEIFPTTKLFNSDKKLYIIIDRCVESITDTHLLSKLKDMGYDLKRIKILCNNKFKKKQMNFTPFCWEFFHHGFILSRETEDFNRFYKTYDIKYRNQIDDSESFKDWLYKLPDFKTKPKRKFKCLFYNAVLHPHRLIMLGDMKRRHLDDSILYSAINRGFDSREKLLLRIKNSDLVCSDDTLKYIEKLIDNEVPKMLGNEFDGDQEVMNYLINPNHYNSTWFSLVGETTYQDNSCTRLTEKTFKASMMHPFIMAGTQGSLQMFKNFGFKTFPNLFDESYDLIRNNSKRLKFIMNQVHLVLRMDERKFMKKMEESYEIVRFNQKHWMNLHDTLEKYLLGVFYEMVQ